MKRMLQLSFLVVAMILLNGSSKPAQAQNYFLSGGGHIQKKAYGPRYGSNRRKLRKISAYTQRKNRRIARARAARKAYQRRKARRARKNRNRYKKRSVASLNKKNARKRLTTTPASKRRTPTVASYNKKIAGTRPASSPKKKSVHKPKIAALTKGISTKKKRTSTKKKGSEPVQIVISLPRQRVKIYKGGRVIASSRISTGKSGHRTPAGVFSIIQKHRRHFSNLYDSAPMPYMQRITWSGLALHAGNVSRPYASHGCIRLPYSFAKTLYKRTRMGAHVIVASSTTSLNSISHNTLFQPMPQGSLLSNDGLQTAAYEDGSKASDVTAPVKLGGIPGFVKPVIVARERLEKSKQKLADMIAGAPAFAQAREEALKQLDERKADLAKAKKVVVGHKKSLRKPRLRVQKIKRQRRPKLRTLRKNEGRANWARQIVEKRQGDPRFEGNWMKSALARSAQRDEAVSKARAVVDEITERLDVATAEYDAVRDAYRNAGVDVQSRIGDVRAAVALLKKATKDIATSKRAIIAAKKAVRTAEAGVKTAKRRETMPLRILITPRKGRERIKDVQKLLTELGYEPGVADGVVGKNTRFAIKAFQRELDVKETGKVSDDLIDELYNRVGRTQKATAHMYVRQGFVDLFDVPVGISDVAKPIGTHVYTAMNFDKGATETEWTAITVKKSGGKSQSSRKGKRRGKKTKVRYAGVTAQQALDRVSMSGPVRRQVSMLLTPGSSLVLSDKGMSHETGKGTDFVVLTK